MLLHKKSLRQRTRLSVLGCLLLAGVLFGNPPAARAGCGCDKPPPAPATVIPNVAFPGMTVMLFNTSFQVGQTWSVAFQNRDTQATVTASVVSKRNITDPTGATYTPQLVVAVPLSFPRGPTSITAYTGTSSLYVAPESFTVIGRPVMVAEQNTSSTVVGYKTGVGPDGTLYVSVGGLDQVCKAMNFQALMTNYPLRFQGGPVVISNAQGYLIDSLGAESAGHFSVESQKGTASDILHYYRHSFEQYCTDHLPGGSKEVDSNDPNWHLDGTPHVDYSTLIFAIVGHLNNGSVPKPGGASFDQKVDSAIAQ